MTRNDLLNLLTAEVLEDGLELSLADLSKACQLPAEQVIEYVEQGVIEANGKNPAYWRFQSVSIRRLRCAEHLQHDLGVNSAGAALALDLLEEVQRLRRRLQRFED